MSKYKLLSFVIGLLFLSQYIFAQIEQPVKWNFSYQQIGDKTVEIYADAKIEKGWHLYSINLPDNGPIPTSLKLKESNNFKLVGKVKENPEPEKQYDSSFQMELGYFEKSARLIQTIEVEDSKPLVLNGEVEFMVCNDEQCLPPDIIEFTLDIHLKDKKLANTVNQSVNTQIADESNQSNDISQKEDTINEKSDNKTLVETKSENEGTSELPEEHKSYWLIFIGSFFAGFAALLTPCVFPMIPMTVSFFTKQSQNRANGIKNATLYGISIIVIYVVLGVVVTALFGADSLNALSTNPWFNLFFALLLIVFAISFFGAFELVLPSSWVNAADKKADKGGLIGIFFMAFTLALVSFSCTGPLVGGVIVTAALEGGIGPVIGMLGFSSAIAIPFFFFAAFPGYLNSLPKSGGWLNSVKVVLGFIELAFAFKFLSVADMVLDLHILEREIFIAFWIVISALLGFYLLGKIKLPHDSDLDRIPVSRFLLAVLSFAFAIYLLPGMWGAPVKLISGFPPPREYAESPFGVGNNHPSSLVLSTESNIGHSELPPDMHYGPQAIPAFDDYYIALEYAKNVDKPLIIDFTGKGCVNCRKMEENVWSDPEVKSMLVNDYVLVSLYVDLRKDLPESEQYISPVTGKKIKTIGNKWSDFQISRYHRNSQPHYIILDHDEKEILPYKAYDPDIESYKNWLKKGIEKFKQSR